MKTKLFLVSLLLIICSYQLSASFTNNKEGYTSENNNQVSINWKERLVTYKNISINGSNKNDAVVLPGQQVTLSFDFDVQSTGKNGYCPGCIIQFYAGLKDEFSECLMSNVFQTPSFEKREGQKTITFDAPTEAGTYYITQAISLKHSCQIQPSRHSNTPENAIATIRVELPNQVSINWKERLVIYKNISINGNGRKDATVSAGQAVSLSFDFEVQSTGKNGYCPGCKIQFYAGLKDEFSECLTNQTFWTPSFAKKVGQKTITFDAPTEAGTYYITQAVSLKYKCEPSPSRHANNSNNAIATILVENAETITEDEIEVEEEEINTPPIDNSPEIILATEDMKYHLDWRPLKEGHIVPWYKLEYFYDHGKKMLRVEQQIGMGGLLNMTLRQSSYSKNIYEGTFRDCKLIVKSDYTYRLVWGDQTEEEADFFVGVEEAEQRVDMVSGTHTSNQTIDTPDGNSCSLNLSADYMIYNDNNGKRKIYVSLGDSYTTINPEVGGLTADNDEDRGWFLYDVTVEMEAEVLGENRLLSLEKNGPPTSPIDGSESTSHTIALDIPLNGEPPTANISETNTVTVNSTDFRAIDETERSTGKLHTRYYLAFSPEAGVLEELRDLVILRDPTHTHLLKLRAGVGELPDRAKANFPILCHGLWDIDKNVISAGVNIKIKATLARARRISLDTGFDHRVRITTREVEFNTSITIPAVRLSN